MNVFLIFIHFGTIQAAHMKHDNICIFIFMVFTLISSGKLGKILRFLQKKQSASWVCHFFIEVPYYVYHYSQE